LGNTDPKKNTKGVLKAFSDFRKKTATPLKLVMLDYDRDALDKLLSEINDKDLINYIHLAGYVVNTDLPAIYSQSQLFLYPSLRESFGIPMLEAMRCGVAVITSNTSSMPEVAGDGAYFVDPFKPEEITQGIETLLNDESKRKALIEKGFKRSKNFSWKAMAEDVLKLYEQVIESN
jgi:glycosyltransferase involved in cell wall biosynthesis